MTKVATEYTTEDISTLMGTNFESTYHLCQLCHSLLKASTNGSIVNISSIASIVATPYTSIYSATKGIYMYVYIYIYV